MNNRLSAVRKAVDLNQADFGSRLGVTGSAISRWEKGERDIPDSAVKLICREFSVSETWLRTGAGDMFRPRTDAQELGELIKSRLIDAPDSFQASLVKLLLRLEPDGPELHRLRQFCEELLAETEKDPEP